MHAEIDNLSWQHDKPKDAETHFKITVVTTDFESLKMDKVMIM
jgi:stress-induced morphogen